MYFKVTLHVFVLSILFLNSSCIRDYLGNTPSEKEARADLEQILSDFAITEEEKNATAHAELFLSEGSTVNFVLKNNANPSIATLTRDQWIGFFTSWDYEYFPVYSNIDFSIKRGLAANSHLFQGFRDGHPDLFGNDLFLYVNTPNGWKIVSLSSTITAPDDETDYDGLGIEGISPYEIFNRFRIAFDENDQEALTTLFVNSTAPCFRFKKAFSENFDTNRHTAGVFLNQLGSLDTNVHIVFDRLNIDIKDQYTSLASASYTISNGHKKLEKGRLLATLVGTPEQGWKLSAIVFSVTTSIATFR